MAYIVGNYRLYTMNPIFDGADNLTDITIRVNRDVVDDVTGAPLAALGTSREISILGLLTNTEKAQAAALIKKVRNALPSLNYGS